MSCNKCNKCKAPAQQCTCRKPGECAMNLGSKCITYDGCALLPLGILKGDTLTEILDIINSKYTDVFTQMENDSTFENIGRGKPMYKGKIDGINKLRTLVDKQGIKIEKNLETLDISIDEEWFEENYPQAKFENVGVGISLLRQEDINSYVVKRLTSSDGSVYISENLGNTIDLKLDGKFFKPAGTGVSLIDTNTMGGIDVSTLKSDTLTITKAADGTIHINLKK